MSIRIGNVGVLDLRSATDDTIADISMVQNVGVLLHTAENASLVARIPIRNLGSSLECSRDTKILTGKVELTREYFAGISEPISMLITGKLIVKPDVRPEDIERGLGRLLLTGVVLCPKDVQGALQAKLEMLTGQIQTYSQKGNLTIGTLGIDDAFLRALDAATPLVVIGKLNMAGSLDPRLLDEKVETVDLVGKALVREEYAEILHRKIKDRSTCSIETIPEGSTYLKSELVLDNVSLERFDGARLYSTALIRFDEEVSAEMVKQHLRSIVTKDLIVCRHELRQAVLDLCEDPCTQILTYGGGLVVVDGEHTLTQAELTYGPKSLTLIVNGELIIDEDVNPETLVERLEHIDNFGTITAGTQQYGAVQARLRTRQGEVVDRDKTEAGAEPQATGNAGYLKL